MPKQIADVRGRLDAIQAGHFANGENQSQAAAVAQVLNFQGCAQCFGLEHGFEDDLTRQATINNGAEALTDHAF